jgi:hypothetical protein
MQISTKVEWLVRGNRPAALTTDSLQPQYRSVKSPKSSTSSSLACSAVENRGHAEGAAAGPVRRGARLRADNQASARWQESNDDRPRRASSLSIKQF